MLQASVKLQFIDRTFLLIIKLKRSSLNTLFGLINSRTFLFLFFKSVRAKPQEPTEALCACKSKRLKATEREKNEENLREKVIRGNLLCARLRKVSPNGSYNGYVSHHCMHKVYIGDHNLLWDHKRFIKMTFYSTYKN